MQIGKSEGNIRFTKEELKIFDSTRGLLSILVVIGHITQIVWLSVFGIGIISNIMGSIANISVMIFFFLSGVLITFSAINLTNENRFNYKKFFLNRITRIYPTLTFSLILVYGLMILFKFVNGSYVISKLPTDLYNVRDMFYVSPFQILRTFTLLLTDIININGPMWSLFIEWWLYISAMFLFIAIKKKPLIIKVIFFLISVLPLIYIYKSFGVGGLFDIAIWFLGFTYTMFINSNKKAKISLLLISLIIVGALVLIKGISVLNITTSEPRYYGFIQILYVVLFLNFFSKLKFLKWFKSFAPFSYTLYLIHFPIILFINSVLHKYLLNNLFYLTLETIFDFIIVIAISYFVAKITENKYAYRKYFNKAVSQT